MMNDKQPAICVKISRQRATHVQHRTNHKSLCVVMCGYGTTDLILAVFAWLMMRSHSRINDFEMLLIYI